MVGCRGLDTLEAGVPLRHHIIPIASDIDDPIEIINGQFNSAPRMADAAERGDLSHCSIFARERTNWRTPLSSSALTSSNRGMPAALAVESPKSGPVPSICCVEKR